MVWAGSASGRLKWKVERKKAGHQMRMEGKWQRGQSSGSSFRDGFEEKMRKILGMKSQSCLPGLGLRHLGGREEFTAGLGEEKFCVRPSGTRGVPSRGRCPGDR